MARERCQKRSIQDSLEDIKERMKEKRIQKLAKVARVNKALTTVAKTKIISNRSFVMKTTQANNKALALALQAEKEKMRQAQDIILQLKGEQQVLMIKLFMLKRKLDSQKSSDAVETRMLALREILSKASHNLLETANLLGPAQELCSKSPNQKFCSPIDKDLSPLPAPFFMPRRVLSTNSTYVDGLSLEARVAKSTAGSNALTEMLQSSEKMAVPTSRTLPGRQASVDPNHLKADLENDNYTDTGDAESFVLPKGVSTRKSVLKRKNCSYTEEISLCTLKEDSESSRITEDLELKSSNVMCADLEELSKTVGDPNKESGAKAVDAEPLLSHAENPYLDEIFERGTSCEIGEMKYLIPEQKVKVLTRKNNDDQLKTERGRREKSQGSSSVPLKKPWENARPRARSKSRDRNQSKQKSAPKEKINLSLGCNDAFDFNFEESIHVTPFRQNPKPEEDEASMKQFESSCSEDSSFEDDLDDSLYKPYKNKAKYRQCSTESEALHMRPRSKRNLMAKQKQLLDEKENRSVIKSPRAKPLIVQSSEVSLVSEGERKMNRDLQGDMMLKEERANKFSLERNCNQNNKKTVEQMHLQVPRFSLNDITNISASSNQTKKLSCPLLDSGEREKVEMPAFKRRRTVTVNYKEPNLNGKLRRGDQYTDTQFLHSPIYKTKHSKNQKSIKKEHLSKYNEAFVGCC
ncbi:shugoshin 1 [Latimeria chalumnae]|uniref:shugoshin 1 n=1 Tax=Latimeria chalumnae TaxID=7897 RepID=UPI0003C179CC|nr:PREDICTED: shugoshin-like 1 [Latimeria chalumnae]XP_014344992.1 PREDICTED: shugoshin-like 1 [Latimeria chalumnae]XP_014344993.1 PREDICTED: shugoshin-like 1 [Latimeria chalumnae]|eukprot:XP_005997845.1 PREDICTED: shugoshin-like 1 [Latimeria chalumnae]